ncbi:MAG: hypothetical protein V4570_07575 [Pseudomonadota bacterium]
MKKPCFIILLYQRILRAVKSKSIDMNYSFRIRFNRSPTDTIQSEANKLVLPNKHLMPLVTIYARQDNLEIRNSDQMAVISSGYASAKEAEVAGFETRKALTIALSRTRVGADFGSRAAKGMFTEEGLKWVEQEIKQRALNNTHGLMVYETWPKPRFVSSNAQMTRGTKPESFISAYKKALDASPAISQRDELSYVLFNASFFQPTADSRFLLLIMAIEALIEPELRSNESVTHINSLIQKTKNAELPDQEKISIVGSLEWLKSESINQAGRRLVSERLGNRMYIEMSAKKFFTHCYQVRSNFVHGNLPIPTLDEISALSATLEVFVSELLTIPLIGDPE